MNGSGIASKKEAVARVETMRAKAEIASANMLNLRDGRNDLSSNLLTNGLSGTPGLDAATLHYQRCIRELEEAINAASIWTTEPKEEDE